MCWVNCVQITHTNKTIIKSFIAARQIIANAADKQEMTNAEHDKLQEHLLKVSHTWDKCIALSVMRSLNDVVKRMTEYNSWSKLKGFATMLQFNPDSLFRTNNTTLQQLKTLLADIGDAPVLADNSQNLIDQYKSKLIENRNMLQSIYNIPAHIALEI